MFFLEPMANVVPTSWFLSPAGPFFGGQIPYTKQYQYVDFLLAYVVPK
jgi:hypothetical protein